MSQWYPHALISSGKELVIISLLSFSAKSPFLQAPLQLTGPIKPVRITPEAPNQAGLVKHTKGAS